MIEDADENEHSATILDAVAEEAENPTFELPWRRIEVVLASPFVRVTALIPVIGYLIVYGDAFQDWFKPSSIGGSLFLSGDLRLRFLYYGGLMVIFALIIYWLFAPALIRRFKDELHLRDYFYASGMPADILEAIHELEKMARSKSAGINLESTFESKLGVYIQAANLRMSGAHECATLEDLIQRAHDAADIHARDMRVIELKDAGHDIVRLSYRYLQGNKRVLRRMCFLFAGAGIALTLVPAVETLLMVILIDFF